MKLVWGISCPPKNRQGAKSTASTSTTGEPGSKRQWASTISTTAFVTTSRHNCHGRDPPPRKQWMDGQPFDLETKNALLSAQASLLAFRPRPDLPLFLNDLMPSTTAYDDLIPHPRICFFATRFSPVFRLLECSKARPRYKVHLPTFSP